ncbi:MAG TPA: TOBE domain-containing protein, partial [Reyranella sp.]
ALGGGVLSRSLAAKVEVVEQLGSEILLETRVGEARVTVARVPPETQVAAGDQVRLSVQPGRLHFFDPESEAAIVA